MITSRDQTVITGTELNQMNDKDLTNNLLEGQSVFTRVTPEQKLKIVHILKNEGEVVAVTGDGVNDSPASIEANVGIAMGAGGTDVARGSADMVLLTNDFASIIEAVKLGRSTFDNLRKFVYYVFTHNWAELLTFLVFVLLQTPLPLLVVQVLAIDLMMDIIPSLSLVMEPPEPDVMTKPPRKTGTRLINVSTLLRSCYVGLIVSAGAFLWAFNVWQSGGSYARLTSARRNNARSGWQSFLRTNESTFSVQAKYTRALNSNIEILTQMEVNSGDRYGHAGGVDGYSFCVGRHFGNAVHSPSA